MMNFSDETVRKAARAIMLGGDCGGDTDFLVQGKPAYEHLMPEAKSALASLTLADLMQVVEVRALVEASGKVIKRSSDATDANYNQPMMLVYEQDLDALMAAHDKFTEAK